MGIYNCNTHATNPLIRKAVKPSQKQNDQRDMWQMTTMMGLIKYLTLRSHFSSAVSLRTSSLFIFCVSPGLFWLFRSFVSHIQVDKVIQLYETMLTRHCTMIVGPTGGGKSVVLNTLVKAQTAMGIYTKCITLNPKVWPCSRIVVLIVIETQMTKAIKLWPL